MNWETQIHERIGIGHNQQINEMCRKLDPLKYMCEYMDLKTLKLVIGCLDLVSQVSFQLNISGYI